MRRALARKLSADVRFDAIRFESFSRVRIEGLRIRQIASEPRIEEVRATALIAIGSLVEMANGKFDTIRVEGLHLRLAPAEEPVLAETEETSAEIGRLELPDTVITLQKGAAPITLTADLSLSGGFPSGSVHLRSSLLTAESILRLLRIDRSGSWNRTVLTDLDLSVQLPVARGRGTLLFSVGNLVSPDAGVVLPGIAVEASIDRLTGDRLTGDRLTGDRLAGDRLGGNAAMIAATGRLPFADDLHLNALATSDGLERLDGNLCGLDAASLAPFLGLDAAGGIDLEAWTGPNRKILVGLDARLSSLLLPGGPILEGIVGRVRGELPAPDGDAPIMATVALDRLILASDIKSESVTPLRMDFDGRLRRDGIGGCLSIAGGTALLATLEGRLALPEMHPVGGLCFQAKLDLEGAATALPIDGTAKVEGTISSLSPPSAEGRIGIEDGYLALPGLEVGPITASCEVMVAGTEVRLDRIDAGSQITGYGLTGIPIALSGGGILRDDLLLFSPLHVEALSATSLDATVAVSGGKIQGTATMESTNPGDWLSALTDLPYTVTGKANASLRFRSGPDGSASADAVVLAGGGFSSEDGSKVAEGLGTKGTVFFAQDRKGSISLVGDSDQTGFQLLWGSFYGDLSSIPSHLSFLAEGATGSVDRVAAALSIPEGPMLSLDLNKKQAWHYRGRLAIAELSKTLSRYQAKLAESYEPLASVKAHGSLLLLGEGILAGSSSTLSGRLSIEKAGFSLPRVEVPDCMLDLPFGLDLEDPSRGEPMQGSVSFDSLTAFGLKILGATSPLTTSGDSIAIERPLTVPIASGTVVLGRVGLQRLLDPSRSLVTRLSLSGLDIGSLAKSLGLPPLEGSLNGDLASVRVAANQLKVEGGGELDLFGGKVMIQDISGRDIFSRYPRIRFRAKFQDIDLLKLTRTFDFGEMSGILEGEIRHLELFRGVPLAMDAEFHTVKRKGVARTINVKAIKNIAILGSGSGTNVFDAGIHKLFDRYTYERLGVSMKLANDVFLLRGEERRGNKELFLKGRLPLRIDVRNMSPGQTVSFSTMLDRIKTLDVSSVKVGR